MSDLKEVLEENSYLRQKQLIFADCDRYQRARVSTLLSIAAAVAGADYDARGLTYDKLYEMREVFLLSRVALRIHRDPRALQTVDVTTWEDGVKGAHMQRVYEIADSEGVMVSIRIRPPRGEASRSRTAQVVNQLCALDTDAAFSDEGIGTADGGVAIFDSRYVWYGSLPLLAFPRRDACSLRLDSAEIAHDLLQTLHLTG